MTDTERIELLKAVARVAPAEMGLVFDEGSISHNGFLWMTLCATAADTWHGPAIIGMLDAMEGAGVWTELRVALDETGVLDGVPTYGEHRPRPGFYECWLSAYTLVGPTDDRALHSQSGGGFKQEHYGTTRAEAVARAFVAVFST